MSRLTFIFKNFLGKNLTIGAPIKIYRRRRRVEFIGGGGVPAAAPTSDHIFISNFVQISIANIKKLSERSGHCTPEQGLSVGETSTSLA